MPDYQELLNQARALGEAISRHSRVGNFFAARDSIDGDPAAQELLRQYSGHMQQLQQRQAAQQPIEPADKQKTAELERQLAGNDRIKAFMRAQADYVEMMGEVNKAMEAPVTAKFLPDEK